MIELDVIGMGSWCSRFGCWPEFVAGLRSNEWQDDAPLKPGIIPARERRRAPQLVKMAVEVMQQACTMAGCEPDDVAVVFSSAMGDMEITDYMCKALAESPRLISPTRFHNSVHNAAPGYWSIATASHSPASAVSAHEFTASMALLEAAIQSAEEDLPVLVVTQELAAPVALAETCPSEQPFSAAFLLAPRGSGGAALCTLQLTVVQRACEWPALPGSLQASLASNFGARLLPLMAAIAELQGDASQRTLGFPVSANTSIETRVQAAGEAA